MMGRGSVPAQSGIEQNDLGNTSIRESGAGSRGTVIGGDASAKTSMAGGGGGGGGGGGSGGGYSLGASVAGSQTNASGQSGDQRSGGGFSSKIGGTNFGTVQFAGGDAKNSNGLSGWMIAAIAAVVGVLVVVWAVLRRKKV